MGAAIMDFDSLPVIDLSQWRSSDPRERELLVKEVHKACTEVGFFYIKNHGIPEEVIDNIHDAARRFFSLPEDVKMKCFIANSKKYHGFSPVLAERSSGAETGDTGGEAGQECFTEFFDIGYEIDGDSTKHPGDTLPPDTFDLYGGNQWPREEACPGFRRDILKYFRAGLDLCRDMMRIFALALDLPHDFFDDKMRNPGCMGRILHYPRQPRKEEVMAGLPAHTDYECLTILSPGPIPALQVLNRRNQWIRADPIPGTLIVNIGDCLGMWTNHVFKSTIHRVSNLSEDERYSVPFFFGVDYDTTISVLDKCITEDRPACTEPFKAGELVRKKLKAASLEYGAPPPDPKRLERLRSD